MSTPDELDLVIRRLNAERYGYPRWFEAPPRAPQQPPPIWKDDEVTRARRRAELTEAWGEHETPVVEPDSRVFTVDSEATKRPPGGASTPLIPGASPTDKESTGA